MPRSKGYETDEMVQKVKAAFIEDGYHNLGIRGIEEKTGLGRFAIRTQFGGKEGLMLAAMQAYRQDIETYVYAPLRAAKEVTALTAMLDSMVAPHPETLRKHGCLIVNSTVERLNEDSDAFAKVITTHFGTLRDETIGLLERGKAAGLVTPSVDIEQAADFILGCVMSVNLLNRAAKSETAATGFVEQAKKAILEWAE